MTIALANRGYTILLAGQLGAVPLLLIILNYLYSNNLILNAMGVLFLIGLLALLIYGIWFFFS
jgi:hypothetical protein